jgi:hypothetical protein
VFPVLVTVDDGSLTLQSLQGYKSTKMIEQESWIAILAEIHNPAP